MKNETEATLPIIIRAGRLVYYGKAPEGTDLTTVGCPVLSLNSWRERMEDLAEEHGIAAHEAAEALAKVEDFLGLRERQEDDER